MSVSNADLEKLKEKYDMLQSLCKQQIMLNETLKSEVSRLGDLYRKVSRERSLLLSELLDNHMSCSRAPSEDVILKNSGSYPSPIHDGVKRPRQSQSPELPKRPRFTHEKPRSSRPLGNALVAPTTEMIAFESESHHFTDSVARPPPGDGSYPKLTSGIMARSRLQAMATHLNTANNALEHNPSREPIRDGSPPAITVGAPTMNPIQRGVSKPAASLLSNSAISGSLPFVPVSTNRVVSTAATLMKNHSVPTQNMNRSSVPVSVIRNPTDRVVTATTVRSPQSCSNLRPSTSGPRILIQPSSTNIRMLKTTENLGGLSEERP